VHDRDGRFTSLHSWRSANIRHRSAVDDMGDYWGMSSRNFSRRYTELMGISPAKAVEAVRVDAARDLLATTDRNVAAIAVQCGFQDDERMRRAFLRRVNTSPSEYRRQFYQL